MNTFDITLAEQVIKVFKAKSLKIATVESCTGGLIGGALTSISGSSSVVEGGFITYSNEAKQKLVNVTSESLRKHGAVSEPVAEEMAKGAQSEFNYYNLISVAVTGIAGPNSDDTQKPVGMVCFGLSWQQDGLTQHATETQLFENKGRDYIRAETVNHAMRLLLSKANELN